MTNPTATVRRYRRAFPGLRPGIGASRPRGARSLAASNPALRPPSSVLRLTAPTDSASRARARTRPSQTRRSREVGERRGRQVFEAADRRGVELVEFHARRRGRRRRRAPRPRADPGPRPGRGSCGAYSAQPDPSPTATRTNRQGHQAAALEQRVRRRPPAPVEPGLEPGPGRGAEEAEPHRSDRQQDERNRHDRRALLGVGGGGRSGPAAGRPRPSAGSCRRRSGRRRPGPPRAAAGRRPSRRRRARIASLLQNPEKRNGTPARAIMPTAKVAKVTRIRRRSPPSCRMSCSWWAAWMTEPAPEEEQGLEEGVGQQVEDRRRPRSRPRGRASCSRAGRWSKRPGPASGRSARRR